MICIEYMSFLFHLVPAVFIKKIHIISFLNVYLYLQLRRQLLENLSWLLNNCPSNVALLTSGSNLLTQDKKKISLNMCLSLLEGRIDFLLFVVFGFFIDFFICLVFFCWFISLLVGFSLSLSTFFITFFYCPIYTNVEKTIMYAWYSHCDKTCHGTCLSQIHVFGFDVIFVILVGFCLMLGSFLCVLHFSVVSLFSSYI